MGGAMFPPYYLTWSQTLVQVMKIKATSFKTSHAGTAALSAPNPAAGHCWPPPPPETPGNSQQVWVNLLWGRCSFLLGPAVHKVLFCTLQESVSPDLCKFWCSMMGLMATSSKRAYAIPRPTAPRAPEAVHFWPVPLQETLKHSSVSVSLGSLGPGAHKVCLSPLWASLAGLILNAILPLLPSCWGLSFALGCGVSPQLQFYSCFMCTVRAGDNEPASRTYD